MTAKAYSVFSLPSFSSASLTFSSITSARVSSWAATVLATHDLTLFKADSVLGASELSANLVASLRMWAMNLEVRDTHVGCDKVG
jgi:hypothetical protein